MALTNRFVTDAGAGAADGTSLANAMSYATFQDYMITGGSFTAAPGDVFLLCGTSQARTTNTDAWVNGGNVTSPVVVRGCDSSGNSAFAGRTSNNLALITTNFPVITYTTGRLNVTGTFIILENLNIATANSGAAVTLATDSAITRCKVVNSSTNAAAVCVALGARSIIYNNDVALTGASGGLAAINLAAATNARVRGNYINGGPAAGLTMTTAVALISRNVFLNATGSHITVTSTSGNCTITDNTFVKGDADGINIITGATMMQFICDNILTDNGGFGINMVSTSNAGFIAHNRTRDNTSGGIGNGGDWITATSYGEVTTDGGGPETDYVDESTDNYNLVDSSPAVAAGLPYPAAIGALQLEDSGGGGGGGSVFGATGGVIT